MKTKWILYASLLVLLAAGCAEVAPAPERLELPATPQVSGLMNAKPSEIREYKGFTLSYNPNLLIPNWVAYELTAEETKGQATREDKSFGMDLSYKGKQARREDYERLQTVLEHMAAAFQAGRDCFPKTPEPVYAKRVYRYEHKPEDLLEAVEGWRRRQGQTALPTVKTFRAVVRPEPYRVERKSAQLLAMLEEEGPLSLTQMIARSGSRSEVTAVFLALLELCRGGKVHLAGTMEDPKVSLRPEDEQASEEMS